MEFANLSAEAQATVRIAREKDSGAIMRLLQRAAYTHYHIDWRLPGDWIGTDGFVVKEERLDEAEQKWRIWAQASTLQGCLAVAADPQPAAWVRVAAIARQERAELTLATMLAAAIPFLRRTAVSELGWLAVQEWPDPWLKALGFSRISQIESYTKRGLSDIEPSLTPSNLHFRSVEAKDLVTLAAIEKAAYAPLWRHSAEAFSFAKGQAFSFDVVELDDRVIGFQLSTRNNYTSAHLARMTLHPDVQRQGIGSALLTYMLANFKKRGVTSVSLNTQVDNKAAQGLYKKFGFHPTGEHFPIWRLPIND